MKKDFVGNKYGRLTVISKTDKKLGHNWIYLCQCECGNFKEVSTGNLTTGKVKSCGCLSYENRKKSRPKHGFARHRLYSLYYGIKYRCNNKNCPEYFRYGGRGIKICDEWLGKKGFENFKDWALSNGYADNLSIDRIDNNGNYCPENCRWVDRFTQQNNTRKNKFYEYNGELLTLSQLSRKYSINVNTLFHRLKKYDSVKDAIEIPLNLSQQRLKHKQ